jgi:hypothetical protein
MPTARQNGDLGSEAAVNENIRLVVSVLLAATGNDRQWLARELGIDRNTLYSRMGSGRESKFSVGEIYRMSRVFDVPASVFFSPVEDMLVGFRKAHFSIPTPRKAA